MSQDPIKCSLNGFCTCQMEILFKNSSEWFDIVFNFIVVTIRWINLFKDCCFGKYRYLTLFKSITQYSNECHSKSSYRRYKRWGGCFFHLTNPWKQKFDTFGMLNFSLIRTTTRCAWTICNDPVDGRMREAGTTLNNWVPSIRVVDILVLHHRCIEAIVLIMGSSSVVPVN